MLREGGHRGLSLLEAFDQGRGDGGLDGRFGVDQPLKVLASQFQQPAGFGAPDGSGTGVAVTASPIVGGELAEVVAGAHGTDEPGFDEDVVTAGQDDIEEPVGLPAACDLLPGGHVEPSRACVDGVNGGGGHAGQQGDGTQPVVVGVRHDVGSGIGVGAAARLGRGNRRACEVLDDSPYVLFGAGRVEDADPDRVAAGQPGGGDERGTAASQVF